MMNVNLEKKAISSSKMTIIILTVLFLPLIIYFIGYNAVMMKAVNQRQCATSHNFLSYYKNTVQFDLDKIERNLAEIAANGAYFKKLLNHVSQLEAHQASYEIIEESKTILKLFPQIMGIFIFSPKNDIYRGIYSEGYKLKTKESVDLFLKEWIKTEEAPKDWQVFEIEEDWYLIRMLEVKQTYIICAIQLEQLASQNWINDSKGYILFSSPEGEAYTMQSYAKQEFIELNSGGREFFITGRERRYFVVQDTISVDSDIILSYIIAYDGVWAMMDHNWRILMFLFLLVFLFIFICYKLLKKVYFKPLRQFVNTMNEIRVGEIDAKMNEDYTLRELRTVSSTFNSMMDEMKLLKILTYEKEMENQRVELQRLQIQIRPHFFLNCLKNLYGMAQERKYQEIQDMVVMFSTHCRYILQDTEAIVTIGQEIGSVKNYIELQKISAAYRLECICSVDEALLNEKIPQMSILTFVENTIKHAENPQKGLKISIKIQLLSDHLQKCINISISDNGGGFPQDILEKINKRELLEQEDKHIGIYNVKKRLELLYGESAVVLFSNRLEGAYIELFIPLICTPYEAGR